MLLQYRNSTKGTTPIQKQWRSCLNSNTNLQNDLKKKRINNKEGFNPVRDKFYDFAKDSDYLQEKNKINKIYSHDKRKRMGDFNIITLKGQDNPTDKIQRKRMFPQINCKETKDLTRFQPELYKQKTNINRNTNSLHSSKRRNFNIGKLSKWLVTNQFWERHKEKEMQIKQQEKEESTKKFFKQNKYNFILNKHYNQEDEDRFVQKEITLEKNKKKQKWEM